MCEFLPAIGARPLLENDDRLCVELSLSELSRVAKHLAESETDLLHLIGACERLRLCDEDSSSTLPPEVELRPAPGRETGRNSNRRQCLGQGAHNSLVSGRGSVKRRQVDGQAWAALLLPTQRS